MSVSASTHTCTNTPTISFIELVNLLRMVNVARQALLGSQSDRTPTAIWYEQQPRAAAVKEDQRCYGLSNMVEQPRLSEAPPAHMKVTDDQLDETQQVVSQALTVRYSRS